MTLPNERRSAVLRTREFLLDLLNPKKTPRVPSDIRKQAKSLLRHYPGKFEMEKAKEAVPEVFGEWDE